MKPDTRQLSPVIRFLSSYSIGLVVLAFMMLLLVLGTLWQATYGLFDAQRMFYSSFWLMYPIGDSGLGIPLPGARLLMVVLFFNLLLATIFRIRPRVAVIGVYIVHFGILLMLAGGFLTAYGSFEGYMRLHEGEASNYSTRFYEEEIVIVRDDGPNAELVTSIRNVENARRGQVLMADEPGIPFTLKAVQVWKQSTVQVDQTGSFATEFGLNAGPQRLSVVSVPPNPDQAKYLSGVFTATLPSGAQQTFILSDSLDSDVILAVTGQEFRIRLRNRRDYYPFSIYLEDFQRETHPGTMINASFTSYVHLVEPDKNLDRRVKIYMNHPLRFDNFTFYQSGFDENDKVSIFQVVKNAGQAFPYISAVIIGIGLTIQFAYVLNVRRKVRKAQQQAFDRATAS